MRSRENAARKLHRIAASRARDAGWCEDKYWGWTPEFAVTAASQLQPANDAFAQAVWGKGWDLPMPVDAPQRAVVLDDLDPLGTEIAGLFAVALLEEFLLTDGVESGVGFLLELPLFLELR